MAKRKSSFNTGRLSIALMRPRRRLYVVMHIESFLRGRFPDKGVKWRDGNYFALIPARIFMEIAEEIRSMREKGVIKRLPTPLRNPDQEKLPLIGDKGNQFGIRWRWFRVRPSRYND